MEYKALTLEEKLDLCINTLVHAYLKEGEYNKEIIETLLRIKPSAVRKIEKALNPSQFTCKDPKKMANIFWVGSLVEDIVFATISK